MTNDNPLTKYGSLIWANYLGNENVFSEGSIDYEDLKAQKGGREPNFNTTRYIGGSNSSFLSSFGISFNGPDSQYNHIYSPLNQALYEKTRLEIYNLQDGRWGGGGFLDNFPVHYLRNKAIGWQSFLVDKASTFLLGYHTAYANWNAVLVQGYPEPSYWLVQAYRDSSLPNTSQPLDYFLADAYIGTNTAPVIGVASWPTPGGFNFAGYNATFEDGFTPIKNQHPRKRPLPDVTSGSEFRKVDIIETWGYTSSSPQEMFDDSGEGGPCFNVHSGCYIIIIDGVEIARLPVQGGIQGTNWLNAPAHGGLHVRFRPDDPGLPDYSNPTGSPIRIKEAVNWLLNYKTNWFGGVNDTGPKYTNDCYDQKQFNPKSLGEDCYSVSVNTGLGFSSLDAWLPNPSYAQFTRHAKTGGKAPITSTFPGGWKDIPFISWGSFPQYGANIANVLFTWANSPYAALWVTMGYGNFTVINPETGFVPARYLKLFFQVEQEKSVDVNNKTWVFKPEDLTGIERQERSPVSSHSQTSLDSVQQQAFDRLFDSDGEIKVTANF